MSWLVEDAEKSEDILAFRSFLARRGSEKFAASLSITDGTGEFGRLV